MFSFIIPCFNKKDLLDKVLASFLRQAATGPGFEIILVDNNSDPNTMEPLYYEYVKRLPLYLVKQPLLAHPYALCRARNLGLRIAHFPWVVTLDGDCALSLNYLKHLYDYISSARNKNIILTGERIFVEAKRVRRKDLKIISEALANLPRAKSPSNYNVPVDHRLPGMTQLPDIPHPWSYMVGGNTVFQREKALSIGGYDTRFDGRWGYEDKDFAYRYIKQHQAIPHYVPGLEVYHLESDPKAYTVDTASRFDKGNNPNWRLICSRIPGFQAFKEKQYQQINPDIRCHHVRQVGGTRCPAAHDAHPVLDLES